MAVERAPADTEDSSAISPTGTPSSRILSACRRLAGVRAVGRPPVRPRARAAKPGVGAFDDHAAFHLCEGGHDVEQELPTSGGGVEPLGERTEVDPTLTESGDRLDQMREGAAEAVDSPYDERVTGAQGVEDGIELGATGFRAGGGVGLHPEAAGGGKRVVLQGGVLVGGGDAGVAEEIVRTTRVSRNPPTRPDPGCGQWDGFSGHRTPGHTRPPRRRSACPETFDSGTPIDPQRPRGECLRWGTCRSEIDLS